MPSPANCCATRSTVARSSTRRQKWCNPGASGSCAPLARAGHESEMAIVVLDVAVAFVLERVLLESEQRHDAVVKFLRLFELTDGNVDVVDADHFDVSGEHILSRE